MAKNAKTPNTTLTVKEQACRAFCDHVLRNAAALMEEEGASVGMILDRLLTFSAAQAVLTDGKAATAAAFRHLAEVVEGDTFDHLTARRSLKH